MTNTKNYLKYKSSLLKFNEINFGLSSIELNPTELCNRICGFCPRSTFYPNKNLNMTVNDAHIMKTRLKEFNFNGLLTISGKGEPLLNKNLVYIIDILANFKPVLITNGDVILKNNKIAKELFDSGLHKLIISEYDDMNKDWNNILGDCDFLIKDLTKPPNYFNNRGGSFQTIEKSMHKTCYFPFYKTIIDYDLSVLFCGNDWKFKESLGNLKNKTLKDIWLSPKMNDYRRKLIEGKRENIKPCETCDVNGTDMGKENFEWFKNAT